MFELIENDIGFYWILDYILFGIFLLNMSFFFVFKIIYIKDF